MKNATKHADAIRSLSKKLIKEHKPEPRELIDPVRALVVAVFSYDTTDDRAADAMKRIDEEFVDLNELRVATELEVADLVGTRYPKLDERAAALKAILNHIFEREGVLGFERIKTLKRAEQRQFLRDLPEMTPFVEASIMLNAFDVPAFPIDEQTHAWLEAADATESDATLDQTQKLVESSLKADEVGLFYIALRTAQPWTDEKRKKSK